MKYIELVKGLFTADHEARSKQADPYVSYSIEANKLMLNLSPEPVVYDPYVTFTAEEDNSSIGLISLSTNQTLEYSTDTTTWNTFEKTTNISLNNGDKVYVRGILSADNTSSNYTNFKMTGKIAASGNCNAIWNYQDLNTPLKAYCGYYMFRGCTSLTAAPELSAMLLAIYCYYEMFRGCSALLEISSLPAKVIPSYAYYYMFASTSLKKCTINAEQIIGDYACAHMFYACDDFTELPTFPKLRYVEGRYGFYAAFSRLPFSRIDLNEMFPSLTTEGVANSSNLFASCLSSNPTIEEFIALNITKEPEFIYAYTLQTCSNLKKITLYAVELSQGSYNGMCYGSYKPTILEEAPILRAKYIPSLAYTSMFHGCQKLNKVISFAESWAGGSGNDRGAYNWLYDVAPEGTLYVPANMIDKYPRGNNGNMNLPTGWNIQSIDTTTI